MNNVFLHEKLKVDIFVQQPQGFIKEGEEKKVYHLKKALYGLQHAPPAGYKKIETYFAHKE